MSFVEIFVYIAAGLVAGVIYASAIGAINRRRCRTGQGQPQLDPRGSAWFALFGALANIVRTCFLPNRRAQLRENAGAMLLFAATGVWLRLRRGQTPVGRDDSRAPTSRLAVIPTQLPPMDGSDSTRPAAFLRGLY